MRRLDIHNYDNLYHIAEEQVRNAPILERNKELILGYRDACVLNEVCGKPRLIRNFLILRQCAALLPYSFEHITRKDIEEMITVFQKRGLAPATIATYKAILRRFLCWVLCPNEFPNLSVIPPVVAWLRVHLKRRDEKRLQRGELFTAQDIAAMLRVEHNTRNRAFVSMLWEAGGRIGEIGNPRLKHITKHEHGYLLDVDGKTGRRTILLVSSAPHLAAWLAVHPFRENPDAPLWVHYHFQTTPRQVGYGTWRGILKDLAQRAGIKKRANPHTFRHSRVTDIRARGIMNESQSCQYFGWRQGSTMPATYSHLVDGDTHAAILRENNLAPTLIATDPLRPTRCTRCENTNPPGAQYCTKCTSILDEQLAHQDHEHEQRTQAILFHMCELLVKQGLIQEAATAVHNAGLGPALLHMAAQAKPRPLETSRIAISVTDSHNPTPRSTKQSHVESQWNGTPSVPL